MLGHMAYFLESWLHICPGEKRWLGSLREHTQAQLGEMNNLGLEVGTRR